MNHNCNINLNLNNMAFTFQAYSQKYILEDLDDFVNFG